MQKSKPLTRKQVEERLSNLTTGVNKLSEDIKILSAKIVASNTVSRELLGVIMALKKKGMVFDDEIAQALTNAGTKNPNTNSVQSPDTGTNENSLRDGG